MFSDVQVIRELEENIQNFIIPTLSNMSNSEEQIVEFMLKDVQNFGIPGLKEPCEVLDLLEQIPNNRLTFYKTKIADIHWNPNRNSEFSISDVFNFTENLAQIYKDLTNLISNGSVRIYRVPSDIPKFIQAMYDS